VQKRIGRLGGNVVDYAAAKTCKIGLYFRQHARRQHPSQVGTEQVILKILVAQPRRVLKELCFW
jgi:hypothetical protein